VIALLQRVSEACVRVDGEVIGEIGPGIVALWAVERGDREAGARRLTQRVLGYRIFSDDNGRMNRSLADTGGGLLMVPQFTLAADTHKGARPSFAPAALPEDGERLFGQAVDFAREQHSPVATGRFGADMKVSLVNDGPVTFWLSVPPVR
jgi:D-aminoacyl-tRNA deacylase